MHDDHLIFRARQHGVVDPVGILNGQPLGLILETLLLHPGHVQDIRLREDLLEGLALVDRNAGLASGRDDARWHRKRRWRNEVEAHGVQSEQGDEAVDCAAVLQVSEHGDRPPIHGSELRTNGVDVKQGLIE